MRSTISLGRPGVLPDTTGPLSVAWSPTKTQLMKVRGEKAGMGEKSMRVHAGYEFWLANMPDPCIIGLDLLCSLKSI